MRTIVRLTVVLLATLPCRAQETAKKKEEVRDKPADYYPIKTGTKWHYVGELNGRKFLFLSQVARIEQVDGRPLARVETVVNGHIKSAEQIGIDAAGVFRYTENDVPISPPVPVLKYPIKEGETWTAELKVGDQPTTLNGKTGKWEKVVVPAGTYRAISVQTEMTGEFPVLITSWFAPGVGLIKQTIDRRGRQVRQELTHYESGK